MHWRYLVVLLLLMAGCGSDSASTFSPVTATASAGAVRLARPVGNVPVELRTASGELLERALSSDPSGCFAFSHSPGAGRVIAYIPNGPTLSLETRGAGRWLWVSPVTTIISRYLQTHPGTDLEVATEKVLRALGIPGGVDVGSALGDSPGSPFSWSQFVEAAGNTPIDQFIDQVVAAVDSGEVRKFRKPDPFHNLRLFLGQAGAGQPRIEGVRAQVLAGLVSGIFSGIAKAGTSALLGWANEATGLNFGTTGQLDQIQTNLTTMSNQINTVLTDLQSLNTTLGADVTQLLAASQTAGTVSSYSTAQAMIGPAVNRVAANATALNSTIAQIQPTSVSVPVANPPGAVTRFSQALNSYATGDPSLFGDITTVRQSLQGLNNQANLIGLYSTLVGQEFGVASPSAPRLFLDWRSNALLTQVQNFLDYYRGYQLLALLLASEWAHLDPTTFSLPNTSNANLLPPDIAQVLAVSSTLASDLIVEQQQVPPATIGGTDAPIDDVLVDLTQNVMWYTYLGNAPVFPTDPNSIIFQAASFSLGNWEAGTWRLPVLAELQSLRSVALVSGGNAGPIQGMTNMGFNLGGAVSSSQTDLIFVGVNPSDSASAATLGLPYGIFEFSLLNGTTTSINTASLALTSQNFFMVRSCPGPSVASVTRNSAQYSGEDPGTLDAIGIPQSLSASGSTVNGNYSYAALTKTYLSSATSFTWYSPVSLTQTNPLTQFVNWLSGNSQVSVSNVPGQQGQVTYHSASPGAASITASLLTGFASGQLAAQGPAPVNLTTSLSASALPGGSTVAGPVLQSLVVTPNNRIYSQASGTPPTASDRYFATGFYSDSTAQDLTSTVQWSVATTTTNGSGSASFSAAVPGLLQMPQSLGTATLLVTVRDAASGVVGNANIQTAFALAGPTISALIPALGPAAGGTKVSIFGSNLTGATAVQFGSLPATSFIVVASGQIDAFAPAAAPGTVPLTVVTPAGTTTANYTYQ